MILIPDIEENQQLRETGAEFNIDFGTTAAAGARETLIRSPLSSLGRSFVLDLAERADRNKPKMTSEEFNKSEFFRPGLKFPNGVGENVARITAERKDSENARNFIIQQGSSQLSNFGKVGLFGTNLMAAMLDPINVGSAFIPIVGQARFASMVSKVGFSGARVGKGVVEGTVGAALVEPFVLGAAFQEQADYNSMDSLLNIAVGGVFGGILHVAGGKIGDIIRGSTPELKELKLRTTISQVLDGRSGDVEALGKVSEDVQTDPNTGLEVPARDGALEPIREVLSREGLQPTNQEVLQRLDEVLQIPDFRLSATDKIFLKAVRDSPELSRLADILQTPGFLRTADDLIFLRSFKTKGNPTRNVIDVDAENAKIKEIDEKISKAEKSNPKTDRTKKSKATRIQNLNAEKASVEAQKREKESVAQQEVSQSKSSFTEEEIKADVERTFKPEADSTYNQQDIDLINEVIDKSKRADLEETLKDVDEDIANLRDQGMLNEKEIQEFRDAEDIIKNANKVEGIVNAIAVCTARG